MIINISDASSLSARFLRLFIYGNDKEQSLEEGPTSETTPRPEPSFMQQTLKLMWCTGGLLSFYLVWGLVQERIMAFKYGATDTEPGSCELITFLQVTYVLHQLFFTNSFRFGCIF